MPRLQIKGDWNLSEFAKAMNLFSTMPCQDQKVGVKYGKLDERYRRAFLYRDLGNLKAARTDLERILNVRPNDQPSLFMPITGLEQKITKIREMIDKRQYQDAAIQLSDLLTVLPKDPELNYLFALCLHVQNKDLELAMKHYDLALQQGFDEFWVKYNRGSLYAKLGNTEQAKKDLMRAVELNPDHGAAMKLLKSTVINKLKNLQNKNELQNAITFIDQTEQKRPELTKDDDWNYLSALCLHKLGINMEEAIRRYDLALEQGFDEFWVKYNRGSLYAKLGNTEQAKEDLMRAVELKPEHQGVRQVLQHLPVRNKT